MAIRLVFLLFTAVLRRAVAQDSPAPEPEPDSALNPPDRSDWGEIPPPPSPECGRNSIDGNEITAQGAFNVAPRPNLSQPAP